MRAMIARTGGVTLILLLLLLPACPGAARGAAPAPPAEPAAFTAAAGTRPLDTYTHLPLSFIPNQGQWDPSTRFRASAPGATFFFAPDRILLALDQANFPDQNLTGFQGPVRFDVGDQAHPPRYVTLRFDGANPHPTVEGIDPLPGTANFFLGSDPAGWRSHLPTYAGVRYRDLYPGIDLVYRGRPGMLKSAFVVAPGADPRQIRLRYEGVGTPRVDAAGRLLLPAPAGGAGAADLVEEAPVAFTLPGAYPERGPSAASGSEGSPVPTCFVVGPDGSVGFSVGSYDAGQVLVIDPALVYSTFVGGGNWDEGHALALDGAGNAVVTGYTNSSDFPTTPGAYDAGHNGSSDVFVLKLAVDGGSLLYSTYVGGSGDDVGYALALDRAGNAVVTGDTRSSDFPTTPGAYDTGDNGGYDVFVLKLATDGGSLLYSTFVGGSSGDSGHALALDGIGNAAVTGYTWSSGFPTTPGAYDTGYNGEGDVFVLKLAADGGSLLYSTFVGGSDADLVQALALDGTGNAVVVGLAASSDFPVTAGAYDVEFNGGSTDVFVLKLAADGGSLLFSTFVGGSSNETGYALTLDGVGNAVVAGYTQSSDFPATPGAYDTEHNGEHDVFVLKLAADGGSLLYSTFVGGSYGDGGRALALNGTGDAVLAGFTWSLDFPTAPGAYDTEHNGEYDVFILKLAADGGSLLYSTFVGGSGGDIGYALALDGAGSAAVTGYTESSGFPTTPGAYDTGYNGVGDVFVLKITISLPAPVLSSISNPGGYGSYLVDWSDVTDAVIYTLQEDDHAGFTSPVVRYTGAGTQFQVDGQQGGNWYYRVQASGTLGPSPWSNIEAASVSPAAPVLSAIDNSDGDGNYRVDWNNVTGATGYTLQEDDNLAFATPTTIYQGATSYYDVTAHAGGTWYYRVRAGNLGGDGPWSNVEPVGAYPLAPTLYPISNPAGDGDYWVEWTDVVGAANYRLEEDDNPAFTTPVAVYQGTAARHTVTGQLPGAWFYRVRAENEWGDSPWSNVEPAGVRPNAPTLYAIANSDGDGAFVVDWSDAPGASGYTLQEDDNADLASPAVVYQGADSEHLVNRWGAGTRYYRVQAANQWGSSSWSNTESTLVTQGGSVYLPLVVRHLFNDPYEPNDTFAQAWGPLASGQTYRAYFPSESDNNDYYYLALPAAHSLEIWLTDIPAGNDYALYLYDAAHALVPGGYSDNLGSAGEHISLSTMPAGKYYVRVERVIGTSRTHPYALQAVFQ